MKKLFIGLMILWSCLISIVTYAQVPSEKPSPQQEERIRSIYIAFITQQLSLTADEAQKFWPIHNQYDADARAIGREADVLVREEKLLQIKRKYQPSFVKILGAERANTFFEKDAEFKKRLLEKLKQLKQRKQNFRRQDATMEKPKAEKPNNPDWK
jgi:hypothetical protein